MQISIKIYRYNPEGDRKPFYQTFQVEGDSSDAVPAGMVFVVRMECGSMA